MPDGIIGSLGGGDGTAADNPSPVGVPISQGERGGPIEPGAATQPGGSEIGGEEARPIQSGPIGATTDHETGGRPLGPPAFGIPGQSIESLFYYHGGSPVGGPSTIFNIGGAPIAVLGGVFGGGLPIGGPVSQIFRSGAPVPNTLYAITLESSGPIGAFPLGFSGEPISGPVGPEPIGEAFREGGAPIGPQGERTGLQL